jgi:nucleoside-diphosphate-sugar epimerase
VNILITGATGFVGRNFLLSALEKDTYEKIYVPVRDPKKLEKQLGHDGYKEIPKKLVLLKASAPEWKLNLKDVDHVVHSAGVIFARTEAEYYATNVDGTLSLFKDLQPKKAVILSSLSASGPCVGENCRTEGDLDDPVTWYGKSKLEMEKRLEKEFPDLNYICLRPPMIFGPRDQATLPLFKMVKRPLHFKPGFSAKHYSFIAVQDLVEAIWKAFENDDDWTKFVRKHFFVASDEVITDEVLIGTAAKSMNCRGILVRIPQAVLQGVSKIVDTIPTWRATIPSLSVDRAKEIWPSRWVASPKEFQKKFLWESKISFSTTVDETRDWYKRAGDL